MAGIRVVFKDPNLGERTFDPATKWEVSNGDEMIISNGSAKVVQYARADIFSVEVVP